MNLDKKDKLFLINQYKILSALFPEEQEDYEKKIDILSSGYRYYYSELYGWIDDETSEEDSKFVMNVLEMFRAIKDSAQGLNNPSIIDHRNLEFRGFDGNEEVVFHAFARFSILKMNRFAEQKSAEDKMGGFNSHLPMAPIYSEMLGRWQELGKPHRLTENQLLAVLGD